MKTNILRQKGTRREPEPGDIFGLYVPPKGWLFGRVIRTDADAGFGRRSVLAYIFDQIRDRPSPLPELRKERLLIGPFMTNFIAWKEGYFQTLKTGPLAPGDAYDRHCFKWGFVYDDEFNERVKTPFEPIGSGGLAGLESIDDKISMALGIPVVPDEEKYATLKGQPAIQVRSLKAEPCTVALYLPVAEGDDLELDEVEDQLGAAVKAAKAGSWEGHGTNLNTGMFETRFVGPDGQKLAAALSKAIQKLKSPLPKGWYAALRYNQDADEVRVEL